MPLRPTPNNDWLGQGRDPPHPSHPTHIPRRSDALNGARTGPMGARNGGRTTAITCYPTRFPLPYLLLAAALTPLCSSSPRAPCTPPLLPCTPPPPALLLPCMLPLTPDGLQMLEPQTLPASPPALPAPPAPAPPCPPLTPDGLQMHDPQPLQQLQQRHRQCELRGWSGGGIKLPVRKLQGWDQKLGHGAALLARLAASELRRRPQ